jgi:cytochrome c peroxidase
LRASRAYRARFMSVFGRPPTGEDLSRAIASYMRTILAGNSPSDRYAQGDTRALSAEARRGLEIFRGKGRCSTCHAGPTLTDEDFHNTGVAWRDERWTDTGRFAVTRVNTDRGAFKTPTLRQIARTAPYMHDGSLPTLDAVIEYYDRGGNPAPSLDVEIKPLHLTPGEKQAVLAFLRALTGEVHEARVSR